MPLVKDFTKSAIKPVNNFSHRFHNIDFIIFIANCNIHIVVYYNKFMIMKKKVMITMIG